jgi:type IV pilus assembly protein PilE
MKPPSSLALATPRGGRAPAARRSRFRSGEPGSRLGWRRRGFTLVECLTACAMATVLVTLALPSFRGHDLRAGRIDAVQALTRVQQAQERFRNHHGLYAADLSALTGTSTRSPQGRYTVSVVTHGPLAYTATATAEGAQAEDVRCATLTLSVREGFAQTSPAAGCWLR